MALSALQETLGSTARRDDIDRKLDQAIEESFPASDPVALAQPHDPEELGQKRYLFSPTTWFILGGGLLAAIAVIALRGGRSGDR
jgi:hypothetical protein